ncbi:MAG: HAD hydrolase-like protein [Rhodobacteraceae bacterium]|nr:HAD hydrolase-like protein [Paracoccaceae bacterium]
MAIVFLDLDGTLTDPRLGISNAFSYALAELGLEVPDNLDWVIGPALVDSFARLGAPDPEEALRLYRVRYTDTGLYQNHVYTGIPEALKALKDAGHILHLATAKPHAYARLITAHFGLAPFLDHEFGPELDGTRNNKGELLAFALEILRQDAAGCVMIGDRHHDYDAAKAVGMASVAVTWGYGNDEERACADVVCQHPQGLAQAVTTALEY